MRAALGTWWSRGVAAVTSSIDSRIPPRPGADRTLYLTFDDGPNESGTSRLLSVLKRYAIPATFFLVGRNAQRMPDAVRRIAAAGHEIGNHSFSHIDAWKASRRATIADFRRGTRTLDALIPQPVRLLRPPYGRVTHAVAHWAIRRRQRLTLWDVMPPDFQPGVSAALLSQRLIDGVRAGSIICLHDNDTSAAVTPDALDRSLPVLLERGWRFELLPETDTADVPQPGELQPGD